MNLTAEKLKAINPATGELIAEIERTSLEEVPQLYENGKKAFKIWSEMSIDERISYVKMLRYYIAEHLDDIAEEIQKDTGKVRTEALVADLMPVLDALEHIEKHAKAVLGRQTKKTPLLLFGKKSYVEYMPRGVVLVISPWNYPFQLAIVPMVSALVAGNTVILKPSEVTPLVGKLVETLLEKVGLPTGVVQTAHGDGSVGAALTKGDPDYIFFTGSVRTGKLIQAEAAKRLIPTTLELGGKDPMIVFGDANVERAVQAAIWGAFTNSGQVCMSVERLYVERSIYKTFVSKLVDEVRKLKQGTDMDSDIGSMTFSKQIEIFKEQLENAIENGATVEIGERKIDANHGMFLKPTVLTNVNQQMKVVQEETFGPILPIIPFDREEEAVQFANDSIYGLNASVWSSDVDKAERIASQLVSGAVVINDVLVTVANHGLPFGGTKQSGLGRYHAEVGLQSFCHEKAVMVDQGKRKSEVQWYPYKGKYSALSKMVSSLFSSKKSWNQFIKAYLSLLKK